MTAHNAQNSSNRQGQDSRPSKPVKRKELKEAAVLLRCARSPEGIKRVRTRLSAEDRQAVELAETVPGVKQDLARTLMAHGQAYVTVSQETLHYYDGKSATRNPRARVQREAPPVPAPAAPAAEAVTAGAVAA